MFRGSSTMKTCFTSGAKSSPRDSSDVVIITCGTSPAPFPSAAAADGGAEGASRTRRNPSRWWFEPCLRASPARVSATDGMPRSRRNAPSCSTRVPLLQKMSTFDFFPLPVERSSCQTRRRRCSMSASRFPPVQLKYSVFSVDGRWCRFGEARRVREGWKRSM